MIQHRNSNEEEAVIPSGLIAHSSCLPSDLAAKPTIPLGRHSRKQQNHADMGTCKGRWPGKCPNFLES